jgi:hypothetical protein
MKKSYGLQSIDSKITNLLKPIFQGGKKEFIIINNLVKNWQDIIGEKYVNFCYPKSITFDKSQKSAKLTIAVYNPAIGFFLENNSEIILERISSLYGFKTISKIIIKQEPQSIKSDQIQEIKLSAAEENFLKEKLSAIEDEELAKTLTKLGREILRRDSTI